MSRTEREPVPPGVAFEIWLREVLVVELVFDPLVPTPFVLPVSLAGGTPLSDMMAMTETATSKAATAEAVTDFDKLTRECPSDP